MCVREGFSGFCGVSPHAAAMVSKILAGYNAGVRVLLVSKCNACMTQAGRPSGMSLQSGDVSHAF